MASFEDRIRKAQPNLSPSFHLLADFLLDSYARSAFLTATELAHIIDVDPATVVRFCQHLGYSGYPALQREIRDRVQNELFADHQVRADSPTHAVDVALQQVRDSLEITRRSFPHEQAQQLITTLDEVARVLFFAEGLAASPARSLAAWLETAGYSIHMAGMGPTELARALAGVRRGDLALAICVEETPLVAHALAEARAAGARTAAIVAAPSLSAALHADLVLASDATPEPGIGQILLESMVYALIRVLLMTRPGRFDKSAAKVQALTEKLMRGAEG